MITAWQRPLGDLAEERLVRFGRLRHAISIAVREDDRGYRVEARFGHRLITRIDVGARDEGFDQRLSNALARASAEAQVELLQRI